MAIELEEPKSSLPQKAISFSVWSVVVVILGMVIDNKDEILAALISITPDTFDTIVAQGFSFLVAIIMLFVGPRSGVKSIWKK
jgi:hypothetical protein